MDSQQTKKIFEYSRSGEKVYADPIKLYRRLCLLCKEVTKQQFHGLYSAAFGSEDPAEICQPREDLYPVICAAFELPKFDDKTGTGTTTEAAEAVLLEFIGWLEKNAPTPPT